MPVFTTIQPKLEVINNMGNFRRLLVSVWCI